MAGGKTEAVKRYAAIQQFLRLPELANPGPQRFGSSGVAALRPRARHYQGNVRSSGDGGGDGDLRDRLGRRRHGSQSTGMAERVKPRSREAVRHFPRGFTRDDSPGEDEWCARKYGPGLNWPAVRLGNQTN
jgi:hypothetical protein